MSITTAPTLDQPTFIITEEIHVKASIDATFASLVTQLGRQNETPDGKPLPMVLETKPGGRWYRELGGDNGHLWGFVQSIKRPTLLEIWGPLFLSTATNSNLMYRLSEVDGGTLISFRHTLVGPVPDQFRDDMPPGWRAIHARVKQQAESARP
ncbi:MAG TPA: SRPBCC domain-containing protein [Vicinamibacterales bacterium]|nr:SRPBCC domain-containing protein [Vicinamibacterales bacterium]